MTQTKQHRGRLRLLATSDLHMNIAGYDYLSDRADRGIGLARTATLISKARAEAEGATVLLFDNGDALQGTPLGVRAAASPGGQSHPLMRVFAHLGYDALGLGNHDFNFGLETLVRIAETAPCPVVCSNLAPLSGPWPVLPDVVLDRTVTTDSGDHDIRVGVLSCLPPQTLDWDAHVLHGRATVDDIVPAAKTAVEQLRAQGADLIIALAHSGLGAETAEAHQENAVIPLAAIDGIDAVVAGHTHLRLPGPDHADSGCVDAKAGRVHEKPVVMPGWAGSHLGVIDLDLTHNKGGWSVVGHRSRLWPVAPDTEEDKDVLSLVASDHAATQAGMRAVVGNTSEPLHSFFGQLQPDPATQFVAEAQIAALRPHLDGGPWSDLPLLSAAAPCKFGGRSGPLYYTDVPKGTVLERHVHDLNVFQNLVQAVVVTGADLLDWLESAASLFHRIEAGSTGMPLVNPVMPGHNFDAIYGLTYAIDLSMPARYGPDGIWLSDGGRVRDLQWQGRPLDPRQRFAVALTSYRANGGGQVAALTRAEHLDLPAVDMTEAIRRHLAAPPAPPFYTDRPWRHVPMPGTEVIALTGPDAKPYLSDMAARGIRSMGQDENGFLRLSVPL